MSRYSELAILAVVIALVVLARPAEAPGAGVRRDARSPVGLAVAPRAVAVAAAHTFDEA
jgi:hypothetical protein